MFDSRLRLGRRALAHGLASLVCLVAIGTRAAAQATDGALVVLVTSQRGTIPLAGATVVVTDETGRQIFAGVAGAGGRLDTRLPPGRYRVEAALDGFRRTPTSVRIEQGGSVEARLDLDVARVEETIVVTQQPVPAIDVASPVARPQAIEARTIEETDGLGEAVRLFSGVFQTPTGLSIKGGRPTQSSLLLQGANVTDPGSGAAPFRVPSDAVQSVTVFPSPYSVEFGRFSSGVTVLETRHGGDTWRARLNNFIPSLRTRRDQPLSVLGIERFGPRVLVDGPLLRGRLFLSQSAEYRYEGLYAWSRPETDLRESHGINTFTRVDANLANGSHLQVSMNVLSQNVTGANMDTFTPPEAAASLEEQVVSVVASHGAVLSDTAVLDSTLQVSRYATHVGPAGPDNPGFDISPDARTGRFFHTTDRETVVYQWAESLSRFLHGWVGEHAFKAGVDVLHTRFDGSGVGAPVTIRRADGTLSRRITFSGPSTQQVETTDLAIYLQDRWQPVPRWLIEAGGRLDRDGALGRANGTLRVGTVVALSEEGTRIVRAGVGLFFERTPSIVRAFEQFDVATDERFSTDGVTPLGPPVTLTHRVEGPLVTPSSLAWTLAYEHQTRGRLSWRVSYLERRGANEFMVEPVGHATGTDLVLSSRGRSRYREVEVGASHAIGETLQVNGTYTRASAVGDLNAYASFFGLLRGPVVPVNEHDSLDGDVPNRIATWVRYAPTPRWLITPFLEFRSGTPYSSRDEFLDAVPALGRSRFPSVTLLDVRVDRRVRILKWEPWIGVRVYNALGSFNPSDVQRHLGSADYGEFFNARPRQIRLQLRFN